jgi:hypothetical protein
MPGDFSALASAAAGAASGPIASVSSSAVTRRAAARRAPGPSGRAPSTGAERAASSVRIIATFIPSERATCSAVVGLIFPDALALGAAIGRPQAASKA